METVTTNLAGKTRLATLRGRKYIVAPMTMLVPGVLNGSKGPLLYPEDEVRNNHEAWNNMPIVVYHPTSDGRPVSARSPEVLDSSSVGMVLKSRIDNGRLKAEGWFDVEACRQVDPRVLSSLERGEPLELSTGLFTENKPAPLGATHNGRAYAYVARRYQPDHLAVLPDQTGACSLRDGCGVLVNSTRMESRMPLGHVISRLGSLVASVFSKPEKRDQRVTQELLVNSVAVAIIENYNPSQPRDNRGRWSAGGSASKAANKASAFHAGASAEHEELSKSAPTKELRTEHMNLADAHAEASAKFNETFEHLSGGDKDAGKNAFAEAQKLGNEAKQKSSALKEASKGAEEKVRRSGGFAGGPSVKTTAEEQTMTGSQRSANALKNSKSLEAAVGGDLSKAKKKDLRELERQHVLASESLGSGSHESNRHKDLADFYGMHAEGRATSEVKQSRASQHEKEAFSLLKSANEEDNLLTWSKTKGPGKDVNHPSNKLMETSIKADTKQALFHKEMAAKWQGEAVTAPAHGLLTAQHPHSPSQEIVPGRKLSHVAKELEGKGWKKTGYFTSSSGRSATYQHPTQAGLSVTLSEPKYKKDHLGTLVTTSGKPTTNSLAAQIIANYSPSQPRDNRGRWSGGGGGGSSGKSSGGAGGGSGGSQQKSVDHHQDKADAHYEAAQDENASEEERDAHMQAYQAHKTAAKAYSRGEAGAQGHADAAVQASDQANKATGEAPPSRYTQRVGDVNVTHDENAGTLHLAPATPEAAAPLGIGDHVKSGFSSAPPKQPADTSVGSSTFKPPEVAAMSAGAQMQHHFAQQKKHGAEAISAIEAGDKMLAEKHKAAAMAHGDEVQRLSKVAQKERVEKLHAEALTKAQGELKRAKARMKNATSHAEMAKAMNDVSRHEAHIKDADKRLEQTLVSKGLAGASATKAQKETAGAFSDFLSGKTSAAGLSGTVRQILDKFKQQGGSE